MMEPKTDNKYVICDTFELDGEKYDVLSEKKTSDYQDKRCINTEVRDVYAWLPLWFGNKFRWFTECKVVYRLHFVRFSHFDDGWTYQSYWGEWKKEWQAEEILN